MNGLVQNGEPPYRYCTHSAYLAVQHHQILAAVLIGLAVTASHGLTLGANIKPAISGEPLDIQVQSRLDAGDDPEKLCLGAEVFYADRKLDGKLVQLQAEKTLVPGEALIRVRATAPVDGPVVTVHLSGGCQQKMVRRYTVLAAAAPRLGAPKVEATTNADKLQSYENNLRRAQDQLQDSKATVMQLRNQLEVVRAERYFNGLVFALLSLLVLAVAGILYLRSQLVQANAALRADSGPDLTPSASQEFSSRFGDLVAPVPSRSSDFSVMSPLELASDFGSPASRPEPAHAPAPASGPATLPPGTPLPRRDRNRFSVSLPHSVAGSTAAELADLQREVERLARRGEQAKAVEMLLGHLAKSVNTGIVVYLNLFNLHQQLGRVQDYEVLRADFNHVFNASIPPFGQFVSAGPGLESSPALLQDIQALWPQPAVLPVLEAALFKPVGGRPAVLDLRTCIDLLHLYELGKFMTESAADLLQGVPGVDALERAMTPPASRRLGVDIDLTEPGESRSKSMSAARASSSTPSGSAGPVRGNGASEAHWSPEVSFEPTLLENLVDFDDHDTGFSQGDFPKPA